VIEASWGTDRHLVVRTVEELDTLLDRIDQEARRTGRPQDVQLTAPGGAGTLGVVVGHDRSLLNHVPANGNPPYLTSRGDEDVERPWRHTIPADRARQAARAFLMTGALDERLRWEEV
jgi:hypothetical protein